MFKINTLPLRECLLLDDLDKLRDGRIFATMLQAAARTAEQHAMATRLLNDKLPSVARLQGVLRGLQDVMTEPLTLSGATIKGASEKLHQGDRQLLSMIAHILYDVLCQRSGGLSATAIQLTEHRTVSSHHEDHYDASASPPQPPPQPSLPTASAATTSARTRAQHDVPVAAPTSSIACATVNRMQQTACTVSRTAVGAPVAPSITSSLPTGGAPTAAMAPQQLPASVAAAPAAAAPAAAAPAAAQRRSPPPPHQQRVGWRRARH